MFPKRPVESTRRCAIPILWTLSAALLFFARAAAQQEADLVVTDAKLVTVDSRFRIARAVAIREGRFAAVGSNPEIRRWIGPKTRVIDARGRTVIPGIIESHSHAAGVAQAEAAAPYEEMTSIRGIQDWVRRSAERKREGEWILIPRSYPTRLKEHRFPTRSELDAATAKHAVVFDGAYSHVLNSVAMERMGITRETPPLPVGEIVRDGKGEPTGLLRNARGYIGKLLPSARGSESLALEKLEQLHRTYATLGITSIVERGLGLEQYALYEKLRGQGRLILRTRGTLRLPGATPEEAERFIRNLPVKPGGGDEWLTAGPLKITVDGGILIGTSYMREPYGAGAMRLYSLTDPDYRGSLSLRPEMIQALIATGHRLGWQMSAHVTGDAGVDLVLDAVEAAGNTRPIVNARFNLIHAYFADAKTAARARSLGVCVDTQPAWYFKDADALLPALGPERMKYFIGVREWMKAGVTVIANTDHMLGMDPDTALNPFNPFLTLSTLITRKTQGGLVVGPDQKLTREEALRLMTVNAAYMTFDESMKGSIEIGKLGDLAILSEDYLTCPEDRIKEIRADITIVGGRVVHGDR